MQLAVTAARAAMLRKEASAGRLAAVGLGAGLGAAGLAAFAKSKPDGELPPVESPVESPAPLPRRPTLRERLQKGTVGTVGRGIGNVVGRLQQRYSGG